MSDLFFAVPCTLQPVTCNLQPVLGGVVEWLIAPVLKTGEVLKPSWVRIPPPPPSAQGDERRENGSTFSRVFGLWRRTTHKVKAFVGSNPTPSGPWLP